MLIFLLKILLIISLLIYAYTDIKSGQIYIIPVILMSIIFFIINIYIGIDINYLSYFIIIFLLLIIYYIAHKQIGMGDILLCNMIGSCLGGLFLMKVFIISLIVAFIFGLYLLIFKKKSISTRIPFAPFLMFATILCVF